MEVLWDILTLVCHSVVLFHHLITLFLNSLALYYTILHFCLFLLLHCQPNTHNQVFEIFFLSHPCSHHISCFFLSTYLPVSSSPSCLSASASIEGPSVPIHHALHFSLLAGINHKYFIIHHGRLSPAHRQFITAALSAGLRWRL